MVQSFLLTSAEEAENYENIEKSRLLDMLCVDLLEKIDSNWITSIKYRNFSAK